MRMLVKGYIKNDRQVIYFKGEIRLKLYGEFSKYIRQTIQERFQKIDIYIKDKDIIITEYIDHHDIKPRNTNIHARLGKDKFKPFIEYFADKECTKSVLK